MEQVAVIEAADIHKSYTGSDTEALKGVTLKVHQAEFFGLLGPNSAGKTTLVSIICGLIRQSSGTIRLFNSDLAVDRMEIKKRIGLVPQEIALYPSLTVAENIHFFGQMQHLNKNLLKEKTENFIETFHLGEHRNKLISRCSGGIKRRVNLVAGIIHSPELLLLDEPTLGVDMQLRAMIFDFLVKMNKAGTTIIYTTHYMKEAENLCQRVAILDHGNIIAEGKPAELITAMPDCSDLGQLFLNLTGRDLRD